MRIDPKTVTPVADTTTKATTAAAESRRPTAQTDAATVVTIATPVNEPGTLHPAVAARIQKIRSALAKGTYPIDLDKLASRIVDDDRARAGSKKP